MQHRKKKVEKVDSLNLALGCRKVLLPLRATLPDVYLELSVIQHARCTEATLNTRGHQSYSSHPRVTFVKG